MVIAMESEKKGAITKIKAYTADENATISTNIVNVIIEGGINKSKK